MLPLQQRPYVSEDARIQCRALPTAVSTSSVCTVYTSVRLDGTGGHKSQSEASASHTTTYAVALPEHASELPLLKPSHSSLTKRLVKPLLHRLGFALFHAFLESARSQLAPSGVAVLVQHADIAATVAVAAVVVRRRSHSRSHSRVTGSVVIYTVMYGVASTVAVAVLRRGWRGLGAWISGVRGTPMVVPG